MIISKKIIVSVLMATYNTPFDMAKRAIDSVLNQDFQDFELIILDDGSDFQFSNLLLNYAQLHENKICYFRHKNRGQSLTINKGISICNGIYTSIIDADDEYKINHLSTCLQAMHNADLVATLTETIVNKVDDFFVPDKYDVQKNIHVDDCILFATLFGKTEVFKNIAFENKYSADSEFYEQAAKKYVVKKLLTRTYIYYRNNEHSITSILKQKQLNLP